ncbi:MAG: glycosyltransferase family 2 protein [Dysgonamonadaceae bacterium]|jgi:GT2 family glycosyltransferase|nr:glycosyltransferase family 2 protein [Dysgonamonadaceae bacterium]
MKLSIITVNYNVKYYLEQCLDSVFKSIKNIETEVIVVDNASSDGSMEYLKPRFPEVRFIESAENLGFARANNLAIESSAGDYVLLLNPDTVIGEKTLENVCRFMDETPDAGAVGVKMLTGFAQFLPESKRGFPSPWNSFCKMTGLARLFPLSRRFGGYHLKFLDKNQTHKVDVLAGAFMLIRREALQKTGGFDGDFFMYGEDIDLSYRISRAGFANYYFPEPIIHYKGESARQDPLYIKRFYQAMLIFFNKHYPHSNFLFKAFIKFAIFAVGCLSTARKMIRGGKTASVKHSGKIIIFDTSKTTYSQIIGEMNRNPLADTLYRIYNPEKGITIDANEVIINKSDSYAS